MGVPLRASHRDRRRAAATVGGPVHPRLDNDNSAPAGRPSLIPVALQQQSGATGRPPRLTIDVSYDEGATWRRADLIGNLAVLLHHPADARSVSLWAQAADHHGNTVEQTIIRAYRLAP